MYFYLVNNLSNNQKVSSLQSLFLTIPLPIFMQILLSSSAEMWYFVPFGIRIQDYWSSMISQIYTVPLTTNISLMSGFSWSAKTAPFSNLQRRTCSQGDSQRTNCFTPCATSQKSRTLVFSLSGQLSSIGNCPSLTKILVPSLLKGAWEDFTGFLTYHPAEKSPVWSEKVPQRTQNSYPNEWTCAENEESGAQETTEVARLATSSPLRSRIFRNTPFMGVGASGIYLPLRQTSLSNY